MNQFKPLTETPTSELYLSIGDIDLNKSRTSTNGKKLDEIKLNLNG